MASDIFDRYAKFPSRLQTKVWMKDGAPFSATEAGKTLGSKLEALETAFARLDLKELRPAKGVAFESLVELEKAEKSAKQVYRDRAVPLIVRAADVRQQGLIAAKLCLSEPSLKPTARIAAEVAVVAGQLESDFKDLNTIFKPFDEARSALVKATDHLTKVIVPHLQALSKGLDACVKTPTRETWEKQCRAPCAAIVNAVRNTPQLKDACWSAWKAHDGDGFLRALTVAEKSAGRDPKQLQKLTDVILRMVKDLRIELKRLSDLIKG